MRYIKEQWHKYQQKTIWSKLSDALLFGFVLMVLLPDGRVFMQRVILSTGVLSSASINEDKVVSSASWQWELTNLEAETIKLSELQGNVIFLNHWGTFCPPCNAEMPGIISLMKRVDPTVKFVFATHESLSKVQKHLAKNEWSIPAYVYNRSPGEELIVGSLPATFIIDKQGKVVHFTGGIKQWDTQEAEDLVNSLACGD